MSVILTSEFIATQPTGHVTVTYPDGAVFDAEVMGGPYGHALGVVRCAAFGLNGRAWSELNDWAKHIRKSHRDAGRAWAQGPDVAPIGPVSRDGVDLAWGHRAVKAFNARKLGGAS